MSAIELSKQLTVISIFEGGMMGTNSTVMLACTVEFDVGREGWVNVLRVVNGIVVVLHTISEKSDSELILKQTGLAQGSTM